VNIVFLISSLALISIHLDRLPTPDTFEFRDITRVPYSAIRRSICCDADHDRFPEFYANARWFPHDAYILEFTPDMNYDTIHIPGLQWAIFWFIGDLDRDGKTDLGLTNIDIDGFFIYESADRTSLPLRCVWQARIGYATPYAIVTDLDRDSRQEIVLRDNHLPGSAIGIFENVADDSYAFRTVLPDTTPTVPPLALVALLILTGMVLMRYSWSPVQG
jgi:hypothetical protein